MRSHLTFLCAAGLLLLAFSSSYRFDSIGSLDVEVARWVASDMPVWGEWAMRPFDWLGGWMGMTPISVALVALLLEARRLVDGLWAGFTLAGIHVTTALLKEASDRARPDEGSAIPLPSSDSFPSGHASGAVVTLGVLALFAAERWAGWRRAFGTVAAALVLGVGASRVVLNVHYATDVLAGIGLGLAWLAAALLVREAIRRRETVSALPGAAG